MDSSFLNFGMDPNSDGQRQSSNANLNEMWNSIGQDTQMQQMPMNPFSAMTADMMNFSNASPSDGDSNTNTSSTATSSNADGVTVAKTEAKGTGSAKRSAAVKTGSSKSSSSSSSKLKNSALTEAEKIARREKHNQVEIRRRKRINQRFNELGDICGCDSKQKRNILTSAIDKLKEYEERIQQLKSNLESLALDDAAAAENGDNSESGDAPAEVKQEGDVLPFVPSEQSVVDHRSVFMKSGVPLHVSGFDGRILDCNEKFAQLFGFTREVILANQVTVFSLTSPDSLAVTFGVVGHLMKGNPRAQVDNLMIGPQGRLIKVKVTAWLIRDNGRPKYFMSMMVPDPNFQPPTMTSAPSTASNFLTAPPQQQSVLPGPGPLSQPQQSSPPQQQLPNQAPQNPQSGLLLQQHLQQLQQGQHAVQLQQLQQQLQQVQNQQQQQQQQQQGGGVNPTQNILPYPSSNVNPTLGMNMNMNALPPSMSGSGLSGNALLRALGHPGIGSPSSAPDLTALSPAPNPQAPQQLPQLQPQQLQQPNSGGQVPPQGQLAQLQQLQQREQQLQQLAHLQQLTMQLQQQQHQQQQQQQQQQAQKKPQQPQAPPRK